jgi:hypothetical protein
MSPDDVLGFESSIRDAINSAEEIHDPLEGLAERAEIDQRAPFGVEIWRPSPR